MVFLFGKINFLIVSSCTTNVLTKDFSYFFRSQSVGFPKILKQFAFKGVTGQKFYKMMYFCQANSAATDEVPSYVAFHLGLDGLPGTSTMWYVRPAKPQISLRIRAV